MVEQLYVRAAGEEGGGGEEGRRGRGAAERRVRETAQGEPQVCERADLDCECEWGAVCVGLHSCRGCEMVRRAMGFRAIYHAPHSYSSGLYLKENGASNLRFLARALSEGMIATEVEGTFRVSGSNKRMKELQAAFETPPRVRPVSAHLSTSWLNLIPSILSFGPFFDPLHSSYTRSRALSPHIRLYSAVSSMGRTWNGRRSSIQHTTSQAFSDDTSLRCLYVLTPDTFHARCSTDISQEPVIPHDMYHLVSTLPPFRYPV